MRKDYLPDEIKLKIVELYDQGNVTKRIALILGLKHIYFDWLIQRY